MLVQHLYTFSILIARSQAMSSVRLNLSHAGIVLVIS